MCFGGLSSRALFDGYGVQSICDTICILFRSFLASYRDGV